MSVAVRPAAEEYADRRERRSVEALELNRRHLLISWARLAVFLAGLVCVWAVWREVLPSAWWLMLPAVVFGALMAVHNDVLRRRERARRAVRYHEAGLDRLQQRWAGKGRTGRRFLQDDHAYAGELDVFDRGGLFELLCTARTSAGEETLAAWLQTAAPPAVIRSRQAAVDELRHALDLREDLAILGEEVQEEIHPDALVHWCEEPSPLPGPSARRLAWAVTALTLVSLSLVLVAGWPWRTLLPALLIQAVCAGLLRSRVRRVVDHLARPGRELSLLASILARLEEESFRAPHLVELCRSLATAGRPPSRRIRALTHLVNALDWRRNTFFAPVAALLMWTTHIAFAAESWRRVVGPSVERWLRAVGELEALSALAGYAYEHPEDPFPEITDQAPKFAGEGLGHPLIPEESCVRNDVSLDSTRRLLVVSGSNMSGKTTLLRTVGINAVLAQAGAPVRARGLVLSPLQVGASVRHQDSIQAGHSRFYAEILRIRRLVELASGPTTVLFLLDEILHGTNSHDRRIGADAIVRGLLARDAMGLVTTHDLALASIADDPGASAVNVHFEDQVVDGRMRFDYRMRTGVVEKSNALELMRSIGLEV